MKVYFCYPINYPIPEIGLTVIDLEGKEIGTVVDVYPEKNQLSVEINDIDLKFIVEKINSGVLGSGSFNFKSYVI